MKEMTVLAKIENIPVLTAFVDEQLEALECPMKAQMQIDIAIDEMVSNIAYYAYPQNEEGFVTVKVEVQEEPLAVIVSFIDKGMVYNPLKAQDPDTSVSLEECKIGGLGIYMVKKSMDEIAYEYKDGKNILTIKKLL